MIGRIRALLRGDGDGLGGAGHHGTDELTLATAALLVEAAVMDGDFSQAERRTIGGLLVGRFGLDEAEVADALDAAGEAVRDSSQLYAFTRVIKDRFDHDERVRMIEMLWEVAYADGHVHDYEASLVRRVAGLVYVPDRESGEARKRVLQRLGVADDAPARP